jgi:uncharacterized membrane protein YecN with MAPEG domain
MDAERQNLGCWLACLLSIRNSIPVMRKDRDTRVEFERTTFYTVQEARRAIGHFNGKQLAGRVIRASEGS